MTHLTKDEPSQASPQARQEGSDEGREATTTRAFADQAAPGDQGREAHTPSAGTLGSAALSTHPAHILHTPAAAALIAQLRAQHGPLMFHQSGGCCDGSSPMCYPQGEFFTGDSDVLLGTVEDTPFYMSRSQFEYWKHTELTLDVVPGRGGAFSLDNGTGHRFHIRSRVFTDGEIAQLRAAGRI